MRIISKGLPECITPCPGSSPNPKAMCALLWVEQGGEEWMILVPKAASSCAGPCCSPAATAPQPPLPFPFPGIHYLLSAPRYYSWNISNLQSYSDQAEKKDGSLVLGTCKECQQPHVLCVTRQFAVNAQLSWAAHPHWQFKWGDLENRPKIHCLLLRWVSLFLSYNQGAIVHLFH